jgi:hypothetical protein
MCDPAGRVEAPHASRRRKAFFCLGMALLLRSPGAWASPIRRMTLPAQQQAPAPAYEAYYTRALQSQMMHVEVPVSLRGMTATDGLLPDNAFVHYLRWRWSLRPANFTRWHPRVGAMLVEDMQRRHTLILSRTLPPIAPPPRIDSPQTPVSPPGDGPKVPEPSSIAVAIAMVLAGAWARRHSLSRAVGRPG